MSTFVTCGHCSMRIDAEDPPLACARLPPGLPREVPSREGAYPYMTDAAPIVTCEVLYSCTRCRTTDAPVTVRIREPDEDLVAWMRNVVVPAIAIAHRARSPWCWAPTISQIKISTIGTPYVGGPVHQ